MAKLIFQRALVVQPDGSVDSYWPELWPLEKLAREYQAVGGAQYFSPSYMCDPSSLGGNYLNSEWLHLYLPEDLENARLEAGIPVGHVFGGIDPAPGGDSAGLDYCAMMGGERIGNRLYMRSYKAGRWPLGEQAQIIDAWMDAIQPVLVAIEESSSRGFVYTELTSRVRDGQGTPWPFLIDRPKGTGAGAKLVRFMAMSARCRVGQILVPGILSNGEIIPDPRWSTFHDQWRGYPAGHDDILDAFYWCQEIAFRFDPAAGIIVPPQSWAPSAPIEVLCERTAHVAYGQTINKCIRCYADWLVEEANREEYERVLAASDGSDLSSTEQENITRYGHGSTQPIGTPRPVGDFRRSRTPGYRTNGVVGFRD